MSRKNHRSNETLSRRVQLVMKPSVFDDLNKIAHVRRISVNGLINELITSYIEKKKQSICAYNLLVEKFEEET